MKLTSTITCPSCGFCCEERMSACQWFYECKQCHALLRAKLGDCCVFCSYGDVPCSPIQQGAGCCKST
ncbi:GDCCVxC domain-containing (seleno)protein [Mariprofundus aestuarium]|uniref:GDCCVxC domain-containing (seleno)protein n=1 Tax=Mariprofundus aestuarium TaxID=1921086 RepID=UPI000C21CE52